MKQGILDTLGSANENDVAIIFFAGHGTPDGRLVLFDTRISDLSNSALSMTELADQFKRSDARIVLCILDCCFSGQAPARVIELGPRPRGAAFGLVEIAGEGRILITACKGDESAWEQPGSGHGLLTHAVIQVFTDETVTQVHFLRWLVKLFVRHVSMLSGWALIRHPYFLEPLKVASYFRCCAAG